MDGDRDHDMVLGGAFSSAQNRLPLPWVVVPQDARAGVLRLSIPGNPALIGTVLYLQALLWNNANAADTHFTGYTADPIQK